MSDALSRDQGGGEGLGDKELEGWDRGSGEPRHALAWIVGAAILATVGLAIRFYQLDAKPFMHDESLFAYYSYCVYPQWNYRYDPLLHGPLLLHLTGLVYFLAGDNDFTARFWPALTGGLIPLLMLGFRRRLGGAGAWTAALLACFSPTLLYYSRFLRNDIPLVFVGLLLLISFDRWLRKERAPWAAFCITLCAGLMVCLMENAVFLFFTGGVYLLLALTVDQTAGIWRAMRRRERAGGNGGLAGVAALRRRRPLGGLLDEDEIWLSLKTLIGVCGAWMALFFCARRLMPGVIPPKHIRLALGFAGAMLASFVIVSVIVRERSRQWGRDGLARAFGQRFSRTWLALGSGLLVAMTLYCALFTTMFRFEWGFFQIYRETLEYWWGQHAEHRLKGPFHYYAPRIIVYEAAPLAIALAGAAWTLLTRLRLLAVFAVGEILIAAAVAAAPFDVAWADQHLHMTERWHLQFAFASGWLALCLSAQAILARRPYHGWFIWWTILSFLEYSYAGEKVPWLAIHITAPLILWAGSEIGRLERWARGARIVANEDTAAWGGRARAAAFAAAGFAAAALFAWRLPVAYELSFLRGDDPGEMMVYNHTMRETADVVGEIEEVARLTGAGYDLGITANGEALWPLNWHLRRYRRLLAPNPLESTTDAIIIADPGVVSAIPRPFDEYHFRRIGLRRAWVPVPLNLGAVWLHWLSRFGVSLSEEEMELARQGGADWQKMWRYFMTREPWQGPDGTDIGLPVEFEFLRRLDTY